MAVLIKDTNGNLVSLANKSDKWAVYNTKTAAEEALTNNELAEGMIVGVVNTSDVPLNPDYSTSEIKTGAKWIDGKPIYRRVFEVNQTLPNGTLVLLETSDIEMLTSFQCFGQRGNAQGKSWCKGDYYYTSTDFQALLPFLYTEAGGNRQKGALLLYCQKPNTGYDLTKSVFIFEYTKTTD